MKAKEWLNENEIENITIHEGCHGPLKLSHVMKGYAQSQLEKECTWKLNYETTHETSCGNIFVFTDDGPEENGFTHCPYCGGKLKTK